MIAARKRDHSGEGGSRNEDDTEIRNAGECLMSEKTDASLQNSSSLVEAASCSEASRKCHFTDSEETSSKRIRQESKFQSPGISSESESQEDDSQPSTSLEKMSRRQSRRSSKRIASNMELRAAASSASECEPDRPEKGNQRQKVRQNTKGKRLQSAHRKKSDKEHRKPKTTLVTLRALQDEEEDEEEEVEDFEPDDESQCFAPEEVNKAPVFVPIGLRSPKPVPVQIEETLEELEISENVPDVQEVTDVESLSHVFVMPVVQREENVNTSAAVRMSLFLPSEMARINDGSTEAAMTLLAMGDPTFQLKVNTEERTQMLPAQGDLHVTGNLVNCDYSQQSVASCQHLLSSPASNMDLFPSEDGSDINLEHQSAGTGTTGKEYFEKNATETSDSSLPMVSSISPEHNRLLLPEPDFGVLRSNENVIQNPVNINVLVEELEQVQGEATILRDPAEMQKVELEPIRPATGDPLDLPGFATESTQLVKQGDITERTEKEMRNTCGTSGELQALTASSKPKALEAGQELYPNQSSADGLPDHNPTTAEHSLYTINLTQNMGCIQDFQQQCTSSTEETAVVNDDHSRCPEEEQTFILTLVEIPAHSREYDDASALLEQTSEPLLPAPILISPGSASGTNMTGVESIGSLTTAVDEHAASLDSKMETKQLQSALREPILNLVQTAQKRSAAEPEEDDFPPAKKSLSSSAEDDLESNSKNYSTKSTNSPRRAAENLPEKAGASVKVLTSVFVTESESVPVGRSQSEALQNSGAASPGNSTSKGEEEVISRLTSERTAEGSGPSKPVDVHESAQLEHTGRVAASSKPPLLRGGRKPLGFLSLICKKSSSESAEDPKGNRGKVQKPRIVTPKRSLKKPTVPSEAGRESCSLPSTSTSSSVECENTAADAAVEIPVNKQPDRPSLQAKDQEKEEAPTRISEYFFSDIFMEVDDSE
ncbi:BDP1 factor, partial [Nothoprocta pentlandii]|nr:BDP1 factor [Nothoprocta pentlandii]